MRPSSERVCGFVRQRIVAHEFGKDASRSGCFFWCAGCDMVTGSAVILSAMCAALSPWVDRPLPNPYEASRIEVFLFFVGSRTGGRKAAVTLAALGGAAGYGGCDAAQARIISSICPIRGANRRVRRFCCDVCDAAGQAQPRSTGSMHGPITDRLSGGLFSICSYWGHEAVVAYGIPKEDSAESPCAGRRNMIPCCRPRRVMKEVHPCFSGIGHTFW